LRTCRPRETRKEKEKCPFLAAFHPQDAPRSKGGMFLESGLIGCYMLHCYLIVSSC
jgi:hypothetical protein